MILLLSIAVIGISISVLSSILWNKKYGNSYIDMSLLSLRKKYRFWSTLGLLIFVVATFNLCEMLPLDLDGWFLWIMMPAVFMSHSQVLFEPYHTADVADKLDELCLYLRPFSRHGADETFVAKGNMFISTSVEMLLGERLTEKVAKLYCIGDPDSLLPTTLKTSCIYASDTEWKGTVGDLMKKSKLIALRVKNTEGCMWELCRCIEYSLDKTLFLIDCEDGLAMLKDYWTDSKIAFPDIVIDKKKIVALFVDSSNCRWVVQELKNARDVNRLVSDFISAHPDLKDELEKKSNFFEVLKKPFSSLTISNIWVHWVIFAGQPIWYVCYNNWPKIWSIILSLNAVILIVLFFLLIDNIILFCMIVIPIGALWLWIAPRISIAFNGWGGAYLTDKGNRALLMWYGLYVLLTLVSTLAVIE